MPKLDDALGIHPQAMMLRAGRARLLATNLANADTPNYRARDVDFRAVLRGASEQLGRGVELTSTHARHLEVGDPQLFGAEVLYRHTKQPSLDQNAVDVHAERAAFLDNALRYQASLRFLDGKLSGLLRAIRGE